MGGRHIYVSVEMFTGIKIVLIAHGNNNCYLFIRYNILKTISGMPNLTRAENRTRHRNLLIRFHDFSLTIYVVFHAKKANAEDYHP